MLTAMFKKKKSQNNKTAAERDKKTKTKGSKKGRPSAENGATSKGSRNPKKNNENSREIEETSRTSLRQPKAKPARSVLNHAKPVDARKDAFNFPSTGSTTPTATTPTTTPPQHSPAPPPVLTIQQVVREDRSFGGPTATVSLENISATMPVLSRSKESCSPVVTPSREPLTSKVPGFEFPKTPDRWVAEGVARAWMNKAEFSKAKGEFEKLSKMTVNVENCKKWKAHPKLNQSEDYPTLDANLFKYAEDKDYVNISVVEVPLQRSTIHMGQMPLKGTEETFWKAFFDLRITFMTVLNEEAVGFFPQNTGEFVHYGSMFVNNRKTETINDDVVRFVIEVLPSGYSNSILSTITVIKNWTMYSVHAKHGVVMKEIHELGNFFTTAPPDENAMVMSRNGAGRAGYFVALAVAVQKMDKETEPQIFEIVQAIRAQRPRAVETLTQYASLYMAMFYYIKRKVTKSTNPSAENLGDQELCRKSAELTKHFAEALNPGKSNMAP